MNDSPGVTITRKEFELIRSLVHAKFGIHLGEQKQSLVLGRLQQVLLAGRFESFTQYYNHVLADTSGKALLTLVDRISTNHTFFFRERDHFDFLTETVLGRRAPGMEKPRVWCAGCSSGEEPYTLAMLLKEQSNDVDILATDISVTALAEAQNGVYSEERLAAMPPAFKLKYFRRLADGRWAIAESIKKTVLFRRLNLVRPDYPFRNRFRAILCRNVMIYFDAPTRKAIIERFYRFTEQGGYLVVGHSESVDRSFGLYRYLSPSIYEKK